MKLTRFSGLLAVSLLAAACGGAAEDQPAIDETIPAPAPAPVTPPADTGMMHMDSTATSTTTAM